MGDPRAPHPARKGGLRRRVTINKGSKLEQRRGEFLEGEVIQAQYGFSGLTAGFNALQSFSMAPLAYGG
jgi:hypothetical protein